MVHCRPLLIAVDSSCCASPVSFGSHPPKAEVVAPIIFFGRREYLRDTTESSSRLRTVPISRGSVLKAGLRNCISPTNKSPTQVSVNVFESGVSSCPNDTRTPVNRVTALPDMGLIRIVTFAPALHHPMLPEPGLWNAVTCGIGMRAEPGPKGSRSVHSG